MLVGVLLLMLMVEFDWINPGSGETSRTPLVDCDLQSGRSEFTFIAEPRGSGLRPRPG